MRLKVSFAAVFTIACVAGFGCSASTPPTEPKKYVAVQEEPCCAPIDRAAEEACHARKCSYGAQLVCMGVDAPPDPMASACEGPCACTCAEDIEACAKVPSAAPE